MSKTPTISEELQSKIEQARADAEWIYKDMPTKAITKGQKALEKKHGTPYNFAKGLVNCIGEISLLEAWHAAEKYRTEWRFALNPQRSTLN